MNQPHKHAELIKAWADGAKIQLLDFQGNWIDSQDNRPVWDVTTTYRIKPESSDLERYGVEVGDVWSSKGDYTQTVARVNVCGNKYQTTSGITCGEHRLNTLLFRRGVVNKL